MPTPIGAMMIYTGEADGMLCGTFATHDMHRQYIDQAIGLRKRLEVCAAMNAVVMRPRTIFIADTHVNAHRTGGKIAEIKLLAPDVVRGFGTNLRGVLEPKRRMARHA